MSDVTVRVHFDPCALDSHDWHPSKFGVAKAIGAYECAKCGLTRRPDYPGGIDRSESEVWTSPIDWESKLRERFPNGVTPVQTPFLALRRKQF